MLVYSVLVPEEEEDRIPMPILTPTPIMRELEGGEGSLKVVFLISERGARITEIGVEEGGIYEARREKDFVENGTGEGGRSTDKGGISGTGEVGVPNANRENTGKGKRFYENDVSNSGEKGRSTLNGVSNTGVVGKITPSESSSTIERK